MGQQQQPTLAVDPNLATEQQQAQQQQVSALQTQASGDTAALMAQYGTRLALAGASPTMAPSAAPVAVRAPSVMGVGA
jgi:hypothetical protein